MSILKSLSLTCPKCNTTFATQVFHSVNTDLSEDLSGQIISGEFFNTKCPQCGKNITLEYDILYHDIKRKTMIWLISKKASNYEERFTAVKNMEIPHDYDTRIVGNVDELREKVAALEAGRDDRVIELYKLFARAESEKQYADFRIVDVFYTIVNAQEIIYLYSEGNEEKCTKVENDTYNNLENLFLTELNKSTDEKFAIYDQNWAIQIMSQSAEEYGEEPINKWEREDKKYFVALYDKEFVIPQVCTCCMTPTNVRETVCFTLSDLLSYEPLRVFMPICPECLKHRIKYSIYLRGVYLLSALVGGGAFWFLLKEQLSGILEFILSGGISIGAYFLISNVIKIKALSEKHSSRVNSVNIYPKEKIYEVLPNIQRKDEQNLYVIFEFTNRNYAERFKKANNAITSEIIEKSETNTANKISILQANNAPILSMFKMLAVFLIVALVVGCVSESIKANNPMHWNTEMQRWEYSYNGITSVGGREKFSQDSSSFKEVYTDIISICPEVGIWKDDNTNYSEFVCKCEAAEGGTIWVYISAADYRKYFDSTIYIYREYGNFKEITYEKPKRVLGKARYADKLSDNLSENIGATLLVEFESVD